MRKSLLSRQPYRFARSRIESEYQYRRINSVRSSSRCCRKKSRKRFCQCLVFILGFHGILCGQTCFQFGEQKCEVCVPLLRVQIAQTVQRKTAGDAAEIRQQPLRPVRRQLVPCGQIRLIDAFFCIFTNVQYVLRQLKQIPPVFLDDAGDGFFRTLSVERNDFGICHICLHV